MKLVMEFARLHGDVVLANHETLLGFAAKPLLRYARVTNGEGRAVLLLPGFGAGKRTLNSLRSYLERCGYIVDVYVPGFPRHESLRDFIDGIREPLSERIAGLKQRTGRPVSLVGQSAGGIYAREFALHAPDNVDRVITLGSPVFSRDNRHLQNKALIMLIERQFETSAERAFSDHQFLHWERNTPAIPFVSIYSPIDGAVKSEMVRIPDSKLNCAGSGAIRENLAVMSSHFGMVRSPLVMIAIADRLGASADAWQRFDPRRYIPASLRWIAAAGYPQTGSKRCVSSRTGSSGKQVPA